MTTTTTTTTPPAKEPRTATVLVVDDHDVNCELMEAMLSPQGYRVLTALSGADALRLAESEQPDLVLLDVHMPGMDGFEVAQRLRAGKSTRLIPVVMVTALGELEHRVRGLQCGVDDYLTKPVDQSELLARVQSSLRLTYLRRQVDERQKLEVILGDVSDGILIVDAQGVVREASPSARRLLGWTDGAQGSRLEALWGELHGAPDDLEAEVAAGSECDFVLSRDQPPLYLAASVRPVHDPEGQPTGAVLKLTDVTRQTLEKRLQQEFLSLVSHKFRTPLTVVSLWSKMLVDGDCGPVTPQQDEALQAIHEAAGQLGGLLEGLLAHVEWSQRIQRLRRTTVSFAELAGELRPRVQAAVPAPHRWELQVEDSVRVRADVPLLVESVLELVENAVKFAATAPVTIQVALRRDGADAVVEVQDDGPGLPPEEAERIFEPFYQVDGEFTGQVKGFGLGLAMVRSAVEAMGGRVAVRAQLGQGTCVTVRFEGAS